MMQVVTVGEVLGKVTCFKLQVVATCYYTVVVIQFNLPQIVAAFV